MPMCYVCKKLDYLHPHLSYHRFPANVDVKKIWLSVLDIDSTTVVLPKHPLICSSHFTDNDFEYKGIRKFLKKGALPILNLKSERRSSCDSTVKEESFPERKKVTQDVPPLQEWDYTVYDPTGPSDLAVKVEYESDESCTLIASDDGDIPLQNCLHSELIIIEEDKMTLGAALRTLSSASPPASQIEQQTKISANDTLIDEEENSFSSDDERSASTLDLPKKRRLTVGTLDRSDFLTPEKAEEHYEIMKARLEHQFKKIRALQQKVRRLKRSEKNLTSVVSDLKEKCSQLENAR